MSEKFNKRSHCQRQTHLNGVSLPKKMLEVTLAVEEAEQQPLPVGQGDTFITGQPSLNPDVDTQTSSTTEPAPPDKYKLVYLIMVIHGVGTLMPWNMFINAKDVGLKCIPHKSM